MKVIISDTASLRELAEILVKLRHFTKIWEEHYGAHNRERKNYWQVRADEWILKNVKEDI